MKTALITGANSSVGCAIASALAARHYNLALHYFSDQDRAHALMGRLSAGAGRCALYRRDLTESEQARSLIDEVIDQFSDLHVLVNVVGPFTYKSVLDVTPSEWVEDIALNLHTCFHTTHHALDALRRSKGHVVNFAFSGVDNLKAWPMSTGYCAAKTGVVALTKSLAAALAPENVRVNAICPGLVEEDRVPEAERLEMAAQIPLGRPVRPEEVATTVAWLVTESPRALTGALISVSAGWEY